MQGEDRRREPRVKVDMPAAVTVLGAAPEVMTARVADVSGSGLLLATPRPIQPDSPLRIEVEDVLLLGEVCRCQNDGAQWRVAVRVHHSLSGLKELERLNRALLDTDKEARQRTPRPDR